MENNRRLCIFFTTLGFCEIFLVPYFISIKPIFCLTPVIMIILNVILLMMKGALVQVIRKRLSVRRKSNSLQERILERLKALNNSKFPNAEADLA